MSKCGQLDKRKLFGGQPVFLESQSLLLKDLPQLYFYDCHSVIVESLMGQTKVGLSKRTLGDPFPLETHLLTTKTL